MINYQLWFTLKNTNKLAVNGKEVYQSLYSQIKDQLEENIAINEIVNWLKEETISKCLEIYNQQPTTGSLNNCLGAWNEYIAITLLSEIIIKFNYNHQSNLIIFSLPKTQVLNQ
jgi:hypothetical protein